MHQLKELDGVKDVNLTIAIQAPKNPIIDADKENLKDVKNIIAVSSCKGGVGNSTVAVNLAFALKAQGKSVGILDADVYGPSLPTMVRSDDQLRVENDDIYPIIVDDIKLMSFGYISEGADQGAAILRGPIVSKLLTQILFNTKWGTCDYLIIDLPPGTGDIQLTLCQTLPLTASVIVTTPQQLSYIDVIKGIEMFDKLNVPVLGAIENMSYFLCDGKEHYPFGQGALVRLKKECGFENTVQLPLDSDISSAGDAGTPFVSHYVSHEMSVKMMSFAKQLDKDVTMCADNEFQLPQVGFSKQEGILITKNGIDFFGIDAKTLRIIACTSALNRDELTGELLINPDDIPDDIYPLSMNPVGNYALGIHWSDGHSSLFYIRLCLTMESLAFSILV